MSERDFAKEIAAQVEEVRALCDNVEEYNDSPGSGDQGCAAMDCAAAAEALEHLVCQAYAAAERSG